MQQSLSYYLAVAKRWIWLVMLGIVFCGSGTYMYTKLETPIYQASAIIVINVMPSNFNNTQASIEAAPTYAQLVTNPAVLQPVLNMHPEMTLQQLDAMITVSAQPNTQLVEIDVQNSDQAFTAQLANELSQSFVQYSSAQQLGMVQALPAQVPTVPIKPRQFQDTAIGAFIGLALAIALIALFEWIGNRFRNLEEAQHALDMEILAVIPYIAHRKGRKGHKESLAIEELGLVEIYRTVCANLNVEQAQHPFKLVMITSAQAGDGKSKIAANIASFLALTGKKVLLVDADFHRPVQAQQFQCDNYPGFSSAFTDGLDQARFVLCGQKTAIPTLRVLTAGKLLPNPAELLQSPVSKQLFNYYREEAPFDCIILDTPPLLALADAQILATFVDATIVVVDVDKTSRKIMLRVKRILKKNNSRVLGAIINKCQWSEYNRQANLYYYSKDVKQPKGDTSLVMYPGSSLPKLGE
jgi:capsular exopolysaccharide synthesis family protein